MFLPQIKNISAYRKQNLLPNHMFPSLATMEVMLTSTKFCPRLLLRFFLLCACVALCFRNNVSSFIHPGSKTISLLPANLATRKHDKKQCFRITIVSASKEVAVKNPCIP